MSGAKHGITDGSGCLRVAILVRCDKELRDHLNKLARERGIALNTICVDAIRAEAQKYDET